mgnify:CR=1 FL=1
MGAIGIPTFIEGINNWIMRIAKCITPFSREGLGRRSCTIDAA